MVKGQLDLKANTTALADYLKKDGTVAMAGNLNMANNEIKNLKDGGHSKDAVNKS